MVKRVPNSVHAGILQSLEFTSFELTSLGKISELKIHWANLSKKGN